MSSEAVKSQFLVPSKTSVPHTPANAVSRNRVDAAFVAACQQPLVVVSAGAGFGKTTAVLKGFESLKQQDNEARLCWLSLDPEDSDEKTFAAYFITAISKQVPLSEALMYSARPDRSHRLKPLFGQLLYELDRIQHKLVIILDDYHLIETEEIHSALAYLAKHLPPHVSLVLTTRCEMPSSMMSLRLKGLVADISAEQLSFQLPEAQDFFSQAAHAFQLEEDEVVQLLDHVEGWVVGLQLIVLGLQSQPSFEELKARLLQKNLNVVDYFESEIFDALPDDVQRFLLSTSIVKRFNVEVAAEITDGINVHEVIDFLQRQNLFIVQFNEPHQWYRYHHLLREFLLHKLRLQTGGDMAELYQRASNAFLKIGYIVGAVNHAINSQNQQQIIRILEQYGDELLHQAHYGLLKRCLTELSDEVIASNPQITLVFGWVESIFGDASKVEPVVRMAEQKIADSDDTLMQAEFETVRSQACFSLAELNAAEQAAKRALTLYPQDHIRRQSALLTLANVKFTQGRMTEALPIFEESELLSRQEANHDAVLWSLYQQSQIWKQRCQFTQAAELTKAVQDYAAQHNLNSGFNLFFSLFAQAEVALETYRLREAKQLINEVGKLCQSWSKPWSRHLYGWLLRAEMIKGKPTVARDLAERHKSILAFPDFSDQLFPYSEEIQLLYWWQCDEKKKIASWLKATPEIDSCQSTGDFVSLRAQIYGHLALNNFTTAESKLQQALALLEAQGKDAYQLEQIRYRLIAIILLIKTDNEPQALADFVALLPLLQETGVVASVLLLRQWLMPLVKKIDAATLPEGQVRYLEQLLILYKQRSRTSRRGEDEVPDSISVLGVSKKEWRVLQCIIQGKSNEETARTMFVAVSTVKTHINNLYKKLSVANRKQAIELGQKLLNEPEEGPIS
ncbi:LuxR C-terminal-related transcriptional regulator [Reinekea marinisedimentorum]|uniref:ATP/maltotriose-dependent transcriptional regulator MalT n=1 Tax=Reinekea marinisedimentorum TaxID=230495 RepID=A0A4R3HTX6_9GAMM|nr:LuxR C-terminal-related transcriptional regulator [Reinekea marinisedimentorum]TCS36144.1 ATP/maltotriose-dependent transcriptional regulator MalT [Reinekea marinisedimentorum]